MFSHPKVATWFEKLDEDAQNVQQSWSLAVVCHALTLNLPPKT